MDIAAMTLAFGCTLMLPRLIMILCAHYPSTNLYRVEVSGWDKNQAFFVEKSELEWGEESGKQIAFSHAVRDGVVIFLRLMQLIGNDRSNPWRMRRSSFA